ncbi:MAG TPA: right-handed parallel beta-helix repeat-containing protein [Candidatus Udaeobacter sp.]|nr:right-handed parallel beta-helix repeat-containing protein [Candidatus Udaeobacter sp.]
MRRTTTFAIGLLLYAVALPVHAATITVTNTNDSGPGSLRQALAVAHDGDRITFAVSGTITLTSGALVVAKSVTISGPGADQLSIVGIPFQSVFAVAAATISGLTIRNGAVGIDNGGMLTVRNCVISGMSVGGIHNVASLTVVNSNVSDNFFGIYNITGELGVVTATILSTTVSGNSAGGVVAAPHFFGGRAYITITDCTISGNFSASGGGGILGARTKLTVANSTISGNSAGTSGGGISVSPGIIGLDLDSSIVNSTISGNSAGTSGGGIGTSTTLRVANCTITGNSAPSGGGIYNVGSVEVSNTILNAGALGENIFNSGGTVTSDGYNLSSDDGGGYLNGPGDQLNTDPMLGPLQDNGGPTFTHALLPGSPTINEGDPNFTPPPSYDQRGPNFYRVRDLNIDIGSFEVQAGIGPRQRPTPHPRPTPPG